MTQTFMPLPETLRSDVSTRPHEFPEIALDRKKFCYSRFYLLPARDNGAAVLYKEKYRVESARFAGFDYRTPAWFLVTICVKGHAHTLGHVADDEIRLTPAGEIAGAHLAGLAKYYSNVEVDRCVIMPNHVHALIQIVGREDLRTSCRDVAPLRLAAPRFQPPESGSLSAIVRSYKAGVTLACRKAGLNHFVWQAGFHDRIVRSNASLDAMRAYIEDNPRNWIYDPERRA